MKSSGGKVHEQIAETLSAHVAGLTMKELQDIVDPNRTQTHFTKRVRELYSRYKIDRSGRRGSEMIYKLVGPLAEGDELDSLAISKTQRARIIHKASGRCQMCGRTVEEDGVRLHVDHKIPRTWGGKTEDENLWALCSVCNEGKKDYFSSFDSDLMKQVLHDPSPHGRVLRLLHMKQGEWVEPDLLEFVANFHSYQEDWQKRLRELRYLKYDIESARHMVGRRWIGRYRLVNWFEPPGDLSKVCREYERDRLKKKAAAASDDDGVVR